MTAAAFGIGGATAVAAAGAMGGMAASAGGANSANGSSPIDPVVAFLVWAGPAILLLSVIALAAATVIRQPAATGLVLAAGTVLFWGMYLQAALSVMFVSIVVGLAGLAVAYVWAYRGTTGQAGA